MECGKFGRGGISEMERASKKVGEGGEADREQVSMRVTVEAS